MNLLSATIKMFEWFEKKESFCETDFPRLTLISEDPDSERAAILLALEELEKGGWVKKINYKNKLFYILVKPFESYNQDLQISSKTAMTLSNLLNESYKALNINSEKCNPSEIKENDIKNLIFICSEILNKKSEE